MEAEADRACHELLLRLAGRLPDDLLWRLRDWLSVEGRSAVGATLPRALLRNRIGLTADERDLLVQAVGGWGAPRRLLDAVLPVHAPEARSAGFRAGAVVPDVAALCVLAVVRGETGVRELRQSLRIGPRGEQRVVLVLGADRPWVLTGTLQRLLRAHGDRTPGVEVLPTGFEPAPYHQAAMTGSTLLWSATGGEHATAAPVGALTSA
ncbi:hypothetical protein [Pseudonocardia asaccharolytica]|uniref:Uncharacterized protein n=1 Tax=Pseudonocardia asaccharolytica DSM 44247 = NBRC 16224 TaxID=1123024 RepID=A0A511D0X2_9PSEU|nr:hypothetical protein [Pseudonocardia asaccharolytica]GEL18426.1 hypothetical protein PA7_22630 [Pseudonocardia asaccharolytica DSM 44247 = NBRC 16224]